MRTGIPQLDSVVGEVPDGWIVEYYGDWGVVNALMHRVIALTAVEFGGVAVVLTQEFGGLNPYLIVRLAKFFGGGREVLEKVFVARAFKLEDTVALLEEAVEARPGRVVIVDPYLHLSSDPRTYWRATPITGYLRAFAASGSEVTVFNRVSKFGARLPEGGNFHHHSVHVLVSLTRLGRSVRAELIKHPLKPYATTYFPLTDILKPPDRRATLLKWLYA